MWELYEQAVKEDPPWPTAPAVAPSASPDTVRQFLRDYEASGVDEIILLLNPAPHEGIMESIEIMGSEILPEFIERDEKAWRPRRNGSEPVIEEGGGASAGRRRHRCSTTLRVRRAAHRQGGGVHRLGDSGGVGRDQRGPGAGGPGPRKDARAREGLS